MLHARLNTKFGHTNLEAIGIVGLKTFILYTGCASIYSNHMNIAKNIWTFTKQSNFISIRYTADNHSALCNDKDGEGGFIIL